PSAGASRPGKLPASSRRGASGSWSRHRSSSYAPAFSFLWGCPTSRSPATSTWCWPHPCSRFRSTYVEETSPGVYNSGHGGYSADDVGLPEWGRRHGSMIEYDNREWDVGD